MRSLRLELGLDSGYLSRLLRSLQSDGLVTVEQGERDKRVRIARLTEDGMNRALTEAINLYQSAGFTEVPPFSTEPYVHHWFEKDLTRDR